MTKLGLVLHRPPTLPREAFRQEYESSAPQADQHSIHLPLETDALRADALGQKPQRARCDALSFQWFADPKATPATPPSAVARADTYRLEEVVHWDRLGERPAGTTSPGIKMVAFVRRLPELSSSEFRERYLEHAEIAREHHPGIARYVQNFVIKPLSPDAPQVDGIAELHFATEADLTTRFYKEDASVKVVGADVVRFMTMRGSWSILATERVLR